MSHSFARVELGLSHSFPTSHMPRSFRSTATSKLSADDFPGCEGGESLRLLRAQVVQPLITIHSSHLILLVGRKTAS